MSALWLSWNSLSWKNERRSLKRFSMFHFNLTFTVKSCIPRRRIVEKHLTWSLKDFLFSLLLHFSLLKQLLAILVDFLKSDSLTDRCPEIHRYADPGEPAAGYSTHAGQCAAALLFCFLHLRHHRRAAVGGATEEPLLPWGELYPVSNKMNISAIWCFNICFFFFRSAPPATTVTVVSPYCKRPSGIVSIFMTPHNRISCCVCACDRLSPPFNGGFITFSQFPFYACISSLERHLWCVFVCCNM